MSVERSELSVERSVPRGAVFLSYASQDAGAALRICEALRAAGVEVWFDQSELRGGDAWDQKIRRQIKECALFVPIISVNTQARHEGYFRLEWHLAEQRSHLIARGRPFIVPVAIDQTNDAEALVPDAFLAVQWMKLPGGEAPAAFCERVKKLLTGPELEPGRPRPGSETHGSDFAKASTNKDVTAPPKKSSLPLLILGGLAILVVGTVAYFIFKPRRSPEEIARIIAQAQALGENTAAKARAEEQPAALSPARQLLHRARVMIELPNPSRETLDTAGQLVEQAKALDPADAEVWAVGAMTDAWVVFYTFDTAEARKERARSGSARALALDPKSYEARLARAFVLIAVVAQPSVRPEAEAILRGLLQENPDDPRVLETLANLLRDSGRVGEAADMFKRAKSFNAAGWAYFLSQHYAEAAAVVDQALLTDKSVANLELKAFVETFGHEDLDAAQAAIDQLPASALLEDHPASVAVSLRRMRREPEKMLEILRTIPRDWLSSSDYVGPKAALTGEAHAMAHQPQAAEADWRTALQLLEQRLATDGNAPRLLLQKAELLVDLGELAPAERLLDLEQQLSGAATVSMNHLLQRSRIAVLIGRRENILQGLETALQDPTRYPFLHAVVRFDPSYDPFRGDPRFEKLLRDTLPKGAKPFPEQKSDDGGQKNIAAPDSKSVAVLAFTNLSDDKNNEYFSDGISEELLNVLAKIPGLKVTARTSSFFFKGKEVPVPEIARQLGVAYVVEGSVRKSGDKVRITAQLIKAADGFHVWSDTFTRDLKDVFAVQDEIAGLITRNLELKMGIAAASTAVNPEAFDLYLQGRQAWNLRTAEGFDRAEELLKRSLQIDPGFARAHAGLADVWMIRAVTQGLVGQFGQRSAPEILRVVDEIQRALALDPDSSEAHASLGFARYLEWNPAEAERELRRSVALNPNYATGHHWLGAVLELGGLDEAVVEARHAAELDPFSHRIIDNYGSILVLEGRPEEALAAFERALALQPGASQTLSDKALVLLILGRRDEALAMVGQLAPRDRIGLLATAGQKAETEAALAQASGLDRYQLLAALGRYDEALDGLKADDISILAATSLLSDPGLDRFRQDPRLKKLLATLNLSDVFERIQHWRAAHPPVKAPKS